ncbi:ring finger domain protein [Moniliophthora roreri MCA 2997]|uniref:Ring finger domain protein n=1 Tax=Moniliophthora roreri (strain MCA 2997) TaxID=1381753 RepID=V2XDF8_MONRO|nr:ring finger domain protein [Moniliophthora roreri MCA 2997]
MTSVARRAAPTVDDLRVKECFICQEVERYDDPGHTPQDWVHPCRCTLIAHQSCLMDLIKYSLKTRRRSTTKCPQCGYQYKFQRRASLTIVNSFFRAGERIINLASSGFLTASVVAVGGGFIYFGATTLGEHAARLIFGDELFDFLLTDELANWPGISLFFVPLIPARFMTRTFNNVISLSGMYFMWPKVPPLPVQERLLENSTRIDHTVPAYQPHKSSWPPRLTQFGGIVTVTSIVYTMIFNRLTRWVLDLRPPERPGRPARPRRRARRRLTQNWDVNLGIGDADEDQRRQPPPRPAPAPEAEEDDDDDDPRIARLEGATGSRHSKIFTGLFIPLIAKGIGHLLYLTSMHYAPLRYILGIRSPDFPGSSPPKLVPEFTSSVHRTWYWQWFTEETIDHMDPVWIRNTIGLGIWVVGRDCLHLFHLWLAKKELASRRLKNRDFAGIDTTQLDLLPRST